MDVAAKGRGERRKDRDATTIMLVEPQALTRQCLLQWLEHYGDKVVLESWSSPAALNGDMAALGTVDLVVWSIGAVSITSSRKIKELEELRRHSGETPIVVLSDREDPAEIIQAIRLGIRGYVPTSLGRDEAREVLRFVRAGGTFVPASALLDMHDALPRPCSTPARAAPFENLTPREIEVVERLRLGKPNKVIAHELQISESTVKVFVHRILTKLRAINRTEVAYLAQLQEEPD